MKYGFIKCACVGPKLKLADCTANAKEITAIIKESAVLGIKVIVLPELCISGATCGDLFFQEKLISESLSALESIVEGTRRANIVSVIGLPLLVGGKLYNCGAVIYRGEILGVVPKTYITAEEGRYFASAPAETRVINLFGKETLFGNNILFKCKAMPEFSMAVEIGADLFAPVSVSSSHIAAGAHIIANLSADAELIGKSDLRRNTIEVMTKKFACGYLYSNANGESTTDEVYSGHSIIAENGEIVCENRPFENKMAVTEIDVKMLASERRRVGMLPEISCAYAKAEFDMELSDTALTRKFDATPFVPAENECEDILCIQAAGLEKRIAHSNCQSAVIGISGGLDSTLALIVCVRAFYNLGKDKKDIIAVSMPCFGTTNRTKTNAEKLCEALGVTFKTVDISDSVEKHIEDIGHDINNHNVVYENAQARERTQVLMDIANMEDGIVVGTGDLSEMALGWATYNGDHISMYGVNSGVPKTAIRSIVKYVADVSNVELKEVLYDILDTPVSPELLPPSEGDISQKTEEIVGPYELHDFFIYNMVRWAFTPEKIYKLAMNAFEGVYDKETILAWEKTFYKRFFSQQFKRSCVPDGPRVGSVALSPRGAFKMPSDAVASIWLEELENIK